MDTIFFVDKNPSASRDDDEDEDDHTISSKLNKKSKKTSKKSNSERKMQKQKSSVQDDTALEEEKHLESLVFDDPEEALDNIAEQSNNQKFPSSFSNSVLAYKKSKRKQTTIQLKPAWEDDQDDDLTVDLAKNKKLKRSTKETKIDVKEYENRLRALKEKAAYQSLDWAQISETNENSTDILQKNDPFIGKSTALPPHQLSFVKTLDANVENPFEKRIECLNFHPSSQLLLVASSYESQFRIFHVDGAKNSQVQSVSFDKFKVTKATFSPNGKEVVAVSKFSQFCYLYDIQADSVRSIHNVLDSREKFIDVQFSLDNEFVALTSSEGQIDFLSDKSKRKVRTFKTSGRIVASTFSPDNKFIYCASDDQNIYVFDVKSQKCVHKFVDEGARLNTSLDFSKDGSLLAIGSVSGVVNVYDTKSIEGKQNPVPVKTIMNLKTPISRVKFNTTSEMLAIHSSQSANAIRLLHTASWTTFQNFPPLSNALFTCFDISPSSDYIALGTPFGKAFMFKLLHYASS